MCRKVHICARMNTNKMWRRPLCLIAKSADGAKGQHALWPLLFFGREGGGPCWSQFGAMILQRCARNAEHS